MYVSITFITFIINYLTDHIYFRQPVLTPSQYYYIIRYKPICNHKKQPL